MKKVLLFSFLLIFFIGYSQGGGGTYYIDFNNIDLPESPNASNLGAYGDIPVNTATGIPNINIPIYTLEVDGLSIPISLSYHAAGVKVNEIPTAVGLKWTLNAGGGIFRTVKSKPDEIGWLGNNGPFPDDHYDGWNLDFNTYQSHFQQLMMGNLEGGPFRGLASIHDHNPDEYSYSLIGWSGNFILNRYGDPLKNQNDELDITFDSTNPEVEDQSGNWYYFGGHTETSNRFYTYGSFATGGGNGGYDGYDIDGNVITGWMLDSIITKNNKTIYFDYDPYTILENNSHTVANHISYNFGCSGGEFAEHSTTKVTNDYTVQLITAINSDNIKIDFEYDMHSTSSIWKKKLTKISINDLLTGDKKEYKLVYGVFNGDPRLKLEKIIEVGYKDSVAIENPPYEFTYNDSPLPELYSLSQDFFGYYNGASNTSLAPKSSAADILFQTYGFHSFYSTFSGDRAFNPLTLKNGVLTQIKYPTGGVTNFSYEPNAEYKPVDDFTKYCGGLRVSKIENKLSANAMDTVKTISYNYENLFGDDFKSNFYNTVKSHVGEDGYNPISYSYNSSFITHPNSIFDGYFYKNVTTKITAGGKQYKKEETYEEIFSFGKYNFMLTMEKIFSGFHLAQTIEYEYGIVGPYDEIEWNILGTMICLPKPINGGGVGHFLGYNLPPPHVSATGNWTMLPAKITTTDFLGQNFNKPVIKIRNILYDNNTLLKTQEITDTGDEIITTDYQYPWSNGINIPNLPKALPISKIVHSNKHQEDPIFGQYFEYDSFGNIKRTFQFNKGEVGNTSAPNYVPVAYEEMSNFQFDSGQIVEMRPKGGEATSYIWGYNNQYPVAKVEGVPYNALVNDGHVAALQNATTPFDTNAFTSATNNLRNAYPLAMVTTYSYKPLAGVETITDPKGDKITYYYDAFGRLTQVKDKQGNILSENEYNYAH